MAVYNPAQQVFLLNILRKGVLSIQEALDLSNKCGIDNIEDIHGLKKFLSSLNKHLSKQNLSCLITKCEISGEQFVVVNQNANDELSKLQVCFEEIELEYFYTILKEIVCDNEKSVPHMNCLNLTSGLTKRLSLASAEALLEKWIGMGYLIVNEEAIHLGVRGIMEFSPYFRTHFQDYITTCNLCSELVFKGKTCGLCHQTMHLYCVDKFATTQSTCPNCKKNWDTNDSSRENIATDSSDSDEDNMNRSKRKC